MTVAIRLHVVELKPAQVLLVGDKRREDADTLQVVQFGVLVVVLDQRLEGVLNLRRYLLERVRFGITEVLTEIAKIDEGSDIADGSAEKDISHEIQTSSAELSIDDGLFLDRRGESPDEIVEAPDMGEVQQRHRDSFTADQPIEMADVGIDDELTQVLRSRLDPVCLRIDS